MDGASRTVLHNTNLALPYALTIDYGTQTLYWADYSLDKLESSSADGSNRRLLTTRNIQSPYAMAYYDGKLYWTDWSLNGIYSTLLSSPSSVTTLHTSSYDTYGICVIAEETQPESKCILPREYECVWQFVYFWPVHSYPNSSKSLCKWQW